MNEYIKINPVGGSGGSIAPNSITGNDITLGSFATGSLTVVDYTNLIGTYIVLGPYYLNEGVEWTAATDNDTTALSIANAINIYPNLSAQVTAVANANVIALTALVKSEYLNFAFDPGQMPAPYMTWVDMTGGVGDFTFPGYITGNYLGITLPVYAEQGPIGPTIKFVGIDPNYTQGIYSNGTELCFSVQLTEIGKFINSPNTDESSLFIAEGYGGGLWQVVMGANDSGGTGYRMLRILNK